MQTTAISERAVIVSMTFPPEMLAKIDRTRGEISRSRYVRNMLEKAYGNDGSK